MSKILEELEKMEKKTVPLGDIDFDTAMELIRSGKYQYNIISGDDGTLQIELVEV